MSQSYDLKQTNDLKRPNDLENKIFQKDDQFYTKMFGNPTNLKRMFIINNKPFQKRLIYFYV